MKNKKIAIYYDKFILNRFGGVENYALFIHKKLSFKFDVFFICNKNKKYFFYDISGKELAPINRFHYVLNLSGIDPYLTNEFCSNFKNSKIITILHMDPGDLIYRIASRLGMRSITYISLFFFIFKKSSKIRIRSKLFKKNYMNSALTLVIAKEYINKFCSLNGINAHEMGKINFLLNPLINSKVSLVNRSKAYEKIKIVWAGRNNRQKRPDLAFKFCSLIEKEPGYDFTVFCDEDGYFSGFHKYKFKNFDIRMPYNDSSVLNEFDVLLLTSDFEGYPLIIIEALSMGLWVICCDSFGAAKGLLESIELGYVYPYNYSMNQVLEIIKENNSTIKNMSSKSRRIEYSKTKFDQNQHVSNLIGYIECL